MKVWKVIQMIYDNFTARTYVEEMELDDDTPVIPAGSYQSKRKYDLYIDYFTDYDDVLELLKE